MTDSHGLGRLEALAAAWLDTGAGFDTWVRGVSDSYFGSRLSLESAARLVKTTPAELHAVLCLASLDDEELGLLADSPPPKTTWLPFSEASGVQAISAGLLALSAMAPSQSPFHVVTNAIHEVEGLTDTERVARLRPDVLAQMSRKAEQYAGILNPRGTKAIKDFAGRAKAGTPFTPAQLAYLTGLLRQMAEAGAIRRASPDGDQDQCDQVLDALGM